MEDALDRRERVLMLLERPSPEHRAVIELVDLYGPRHEEAAGLLDIKEGTLKSRLLAARRELVAWAERLLPESERGCR